MNKLALGAARGRAAASMRRVQISFAGMRTATVLRPPVVIAGTATALECSSVEVLFLRSTRVNGPGQNLEASFSASLGHSLTKRFACATLETCTMSGFSGGRPLA